MPLAATLANLILAPSGTGVSGLDFKPVLTVIGDTRSRLRLRAAAASAVVMVSTSPTVAGVAVATSPSVTVSLPVTLQLVVSSDTV